MNYTFTHDDVSYSRYTHLGREIMRVTPRISMRERIKRFMTIWSILATITALTFVASATA